LTTSLVHLKSNQIIKFFKNQKSKAMNKKIFLVAVLSLAMTQLWSQSAPNSRIPLLGEEAPSFIAESTKGTIEFPGQYGGKWKILFSHPADFTPVCSTEIMELALMQQDFKDLNTQIVVVSTDDIKRHRTWVDAMENTLLKEDKPVKVNFPLVEDSKYNVCWEYGMITPSVDSRHAVRGVFIIDPKNKIRSISFSPSSVGRNLDEVKRTLIALQTADKNTVLTPVNWKPGDDILLPYPNSVSYYEDHNKKTTDGTNDLTGLLLYEKLDK
jgi:peroxiredoxin (alkyl hydroperoxide reductase subunit C)